MGRLLMASRSRLRFYAWLFFLTCPAHAPADKLRIASSPPGATVEFDGVAMGTTPFEKDYPGAISTKQSRRSISEGRFFVPPAYQRGWSAPGRSSLGHRKSRRCHAFQRDKEASTVGSDGVGTIVISSAPVGAEIFVDEKFHGNTPATLRFPTGSHAMVLKFPGRADWKRTREVLKSSKVTLRATLDRAP
jgi:PEGA domain